MRKKIISLVIVCIGIARGTLFSETAVLPYKVENPSTFLTEETGVDYAKLLSLAAVVSKKDVVITSPAMIEGDLKRLNLDPQNSISGKDLDRLGKTGHIDRFLLGKIMKIKGKYFSESVLYSVGDRRVIARFKVSGPSLFKLAEEEMKEVFADYGDREAVREKGSLDIAFIIDMSYAMASDWKSVKKAVLAVSSKAVDTLGVDTRIYLVPFSKKVTAESASGSVNSLIQLKKNLSQLNPIGANSGASLEHSLGYSVKNVKWRHDAAKVIIIITNSDVSGSSFSEQHALRAKKMGIVIHAVTLGAMNEDEDAPIERITGISGGVTLGAAYHQKIYDKDAGAVELYMEKERLFKSDLFVSTWKDGLMKAGKGKKYGAPRESFEEIFIETKGTRPDPYNLPDLYNKLTFTPIINKEKLVSNVDHVMMRLFSLSMKGGTKTGGPRGKVLLTDGTISFWSPLWDNDSLKFFKDKSNFKFYFPLGIVIRDDPAETYGLSFIPSVRGISSDYVPEMIKKNLSDMIQKKNYFMHEGLFFPPVWFVDAKVEEVIQFGGKGDVRED